jgi:hypothetical protein
MRKIPRPLVARVLFSGILFIPIVAQGEDSIKVSVDWNKTVMLSKAEPTFMVEAHPLLRTGSPIHDTAFSTIRDLGARFVRYHGQEFWPRLVVAELEPPSQDKTSWDFAALDSLVIPFLEATKGRDPVLDFNTIPVWMFKTDKPVRYPEDPDQPLLGEDLYSQGTKLVDPTGEQLAGYYARLLSWYSQGGFTDELGHYHHSGYHYEIPWWEVLNEVQAEHQTTPQQYVVEYDAIVAAIHRISPKTKFIGLSLAPMGRLSGTSGPSHEPDFFQYFLDPKNHRPGTPLDMISYHFYASPGANQPPESWQYSFFDQADGFLNTVALIDSIRARLSPATRVNLAELGIILPEYFMTRDQRSGTNLATPPWYWNLSGALYAYLYIGLAQRGADVVTASQFLGDPIEESGNPLGIDPYDSIPLIDWKTGRPNARFRVLELLKENFGAGDRLVATNMDELNTVLPSDVAVQAFVTARGKKLLVINKRMRPADLDLTKVGAATGMEEVDMTTCENPPHEVSPIGDTLHLEPFAVAVVTFGN